MAITETDSIHEDTMGFLFDCTGTLMQEGSITYIFKEYHGKYKNLQSSIMKTFFLNI